MTKQISEIAIVGAGTMGANIALSFAMHGQPVRLFDVNEEQLKKAAAMIRANAELLQEQGLLKEPVEQVARRVTGECNLTTSVSEAHLIIEAIPEKIQLKYELFTELERMCGAEAIIASNTSSFAPTLLGQGFVNPERRHRLIVMHYWNPAHLLPLVELVPHPETIAAVVADVMSLLARCGKKPVLVKKEIPGFIGNRLAFALQREAMDLVATGIATPEDIDAVAKSSFGRRIAISGIFGTADLGGLDVYLEVCRTLFPTLCNDFSPPEGLRRLVAEGNLGMKSGVGWKHYTEKESAALREALAKELIHHLKRDLQAATDLSGEQ